VGLTWLCLAASLVLGLLAGSLPIPRSFFRELPPVGRLPAGGLGIALAGLLLLLEHLRRRGAFRSRSIACSLGLLAASGVVLYLIRPRLHWGDSAVLVGSLESGAHRWNPRWALSMIGLAYAFDPWRSLCSGTLFLTLVYLGIGCLGIALLVTTLRVVADGHPVPLHAAVLVLASPATLLLFSGYLEIYPVPHFGIALFLWAGAGLAFGRRWMGFLRFGLVSGLASMLYIGNLLLAVCGSALVAGRLLAQHPPGRRLVPAGRFLLGAVASAYVAVCLLLGEWVVGPWQFLRTFPWLLQEANDVVRLEATGSTWQSVLPDAFESRRLWQWLETWSLYGFFGLLLAAACASLGLVSGPVRRSFAEETRRGYIPALAGLALAYLVASYVKRPVMGWRDWDLFLYAAYPANLLGACLLVRLRHVAPEVLWLGRGFALCAVVWGVIAYSYVNPIRPEWNALPHRRRVDAFESYDVTRRTAAPCVGGCETEFMP
jgi:hypothetical protein